MKLRKLTKKRSRQPLPSRGICLLSRPPPFIACRNLNCAEAAC